MQTLQQAIAEACADVGNDDIVSYRNCYNGRGMYARHCIGIVGKMSECMLTIAQIVKNRVDDLVAVAETQQCSGSDVVADKHLQFSNDIDELLNFETDSMGTDVILYWRNLEPMPGLES